MNMRMTRRGAVIIIVLMMIAVPAAAAVMTQNFMQADFTTEAPCFTKIAGLDAGTGFVNFDDALTISANGVDLIEEQVQFSGFIGDRVVYTDPVRFVSACVDPIDVMLISAANAQGQPAVDPPSPSPIWNNVNVYVYVARVDSPTGVPPVGSGSNAEWAYQFSITNGGNHDDTGALAVRMSNTQERRLGIVVDTDAASAAALDGTLRWIAQATHLPTP